MAVMPESYLDLWREATVEHLIEYFDAEPESLKYPGPGDYSALDRLLETLAKVDPEAAERFRKMRR